MVILVWGAFLVFHNTLQLGELMAILSVSGSTVGSAYSLSTANLKLQEARVAFERMYEFVSLQPEVTHKNAKDVKEVSTIAVQEVHFRFQGRKHVLKGVNLTLRKGEITALIGESGSGKSTLISILQKFYTPEKGEILVDGEPWQHLSLQSWRNAIAVVPQHVKLFNGSLIENICFDKASKELNEFIGFSQEYGFHSYFEKFPQGYATILGEDGTNISGGQMQLVALARALYKKPKFLILDEPTAALDTKTEQFVLTLLDQLRNDMIILLVTHRLHSTRIASSVYRLNEGSLELQNEPVFS